MGKTSLINRYMNNKFDEHYKPTIVCEFGAKDVNIKGTLLRIQLWDIGGQEYLGGISKLICRDAKACVIVCDATKNLTLNQYS